MVFLVSGVCVQSNDKDPDRHFTVPSNGVSPKQPLDFRDQPASNWSQVEPHPSMTRPGDPAGPWRGTYSMDSPASGQFIGIAGIAPSSASWANTNPVVGSQDAVAWADYSVPVRSMSYSGNLAGNNSQAQYFSMPQTQPFPRRHSNFSDMYPSAMGAPVANMGRSAADSGDTSASMSIGAMPSNNQGYWPQQTPPYQLSPYVKEGDDPMRGGYGEGQGFHNH